jgi:hypothetical protein
MNKIPISEVKNFKEWCCGKNLEEGFLCGDFFNKTQNIICDDCLMNLTIRKSKIASIRKELIENMRHLESSKRAIFFGYERMDEVLQQQIKRLQDDRN